MKCQILLGQMQNNYPGQYAPDTLEIMSEFMLEENPDYLSDIIEKWEKNKDHKYGLYVELKIIEIEIPDSILDNIFDIPDKKTAIY